MEPQYTFALSRMTAQVVVDYSSCTPNGVGEVVNIEARGTPKATIVEKLGLPINSPRSENQRTKVVLRVEHRCRINE